MSKNTWHAFYNKKNSLSEFIHNIHEHRLFFEELLKDNPKKILEVGSGTGQMAIFLSYLGYSVTSIDNDKTVLKNAQNYSKEFSGSVSFEYADAFSMPYKNNQFDIAFHQGLLEHFSDEDIHKLLDEQLRVSKAVIFSVPNNFYPKQDFGNERLMTKEQWEYILKKYKIVISQNYFDHWIAKKPHPRVFITSSNHKVMYMAKLEKKG